MIRFFSDLRLVHKLALPAVVLVVSGLITLVTAAHWHDTFERQTLSIVNRDTVRYQLALKVVSDLVVGALISRDVRLAGTVDEVEQLAAKNRRLGADIEEELARLEQLMDVPAQRQTVVDASAAFREFEADIRGTVDAKLDSLRNNAPAPMGGKGRVVRARLDQILDTIVAFSSEDMQRAKSEAIATGRDATLTVVYGSALARILALALLVWIAVTQIVRPLDRMSGLMKQLADGDLDVPVVGAARGDEIGTLARSLQVFKDNAIKLQAANAQLARAKEEAEDANRAMQVANATLESRVAERTAELRAAHDELLRAERLSVLGRLTATVAHDLRNPLSTIRNTLFSTRQLPAAEDAALERPFSRMQKAVDRCDRIIQDLLDYARPPEPIKVSTAFDAWLADALEAQTEHAGVTIVREFGAGGAFVKVDHDRFRRVIANLVDNAVEAMSDPDAPLAQRQITVRSRIVSDRLELSVADTGPGIAADILPKVFEPLFSTKTFASGLGLPTVKQIVAQHGGAVEIESEAGSGATVRITLACAVPTAQQAA
ncbi:MAG TPA: ATP-binding protein [Stellaceae bacterium]|nr:ATP-binding protein [Stellaceae bacterium]